MNDLNNINLEFQCPENRQFLKGRDGQFWCDKCSKKVIDFTKSSMDELNNKIDGSKSPICGIFKRSQLSEQFVKYAAATFIITSSLTGQSFGQVKVDSIEQTCTNLNEHEHSHEFFGAIVEVQAHPVGGYSEFFKTFASEIKLPKDLESPPGKIYIRFTIDTLGKMNQIEIVKTTNKLAAETVVETLKRLDYPFEPAQQRGKKVNSRLLVPIIIDVD